MAFTQTDIDNIDRAIVNLITFKQPVQFVIDGEQITYPVHKLADLRELRNAIATEVAAADASVETITAIQIFGSKGL